jgi:surface antigen
MRSRLSRCVATVLLVALAFPALSCQTLADTTSDNPKAVLGSLGVAAAGAGIAAIAGASSGWIVAAGLAGGLLGGAIGHRLDNQDKQMAAEAAARAFETNRTGQTAAWKNPDSGNQGTITPTKTYQAGDGKYCREYRQEVIIGGEKQQAYGTACRQTDGSWQIQS